MRAAIGGWWSFQAPFTKDKWPFWAQPLFPLITDGAHKGLLRYLNRPALREMHVVDANFYTVLAMRSFNRGPPLLPCGKEEAEIAISSGEAVGLKHWRRFCSEKFKLAEYLRRFAALMAWDLEVYDSLEGRGGRSRFGEPLAEVWCPISALCLRHNGTSCGPAC